MASPDPTPSLGVAALIAGATLTDAQWHELEAATPPLPWHATVLPHVVDMGDSADTFAVVHSDTADTAAIATLIVALRNALPDYLELRANTTDSPRLECGECGLPMARNPHPDAGAPTMAGVAVGYTYECVPCLVASRNRAGRNWRTAATLLEATQRVTIAAKRLRDHEASEPSSAMTTGPEWEAWNAWELAAEPLRTELDEALAVLTPPTESETSQLDEARQTDEPTPKKWCKHCGREVAPDMTHVPKPSGGSFACSSVPLAGPSPTPQGSPR